MKHKGKNQQDWFGLALLIIFGVFTVVFASGILYVAHREAVTREAPRVTVLPVFASADAEPLPAVLEPSAFQEPRIQSAFAMARPEAPPSWPSSFAAAAIATDTGDCLTASKRARGKMLHMHS